MPLFFRSHRRASHSGDAPRVAVVAQNVAACSAAGGGGGGGVVVVGGGGGTNEDWGPDWGPENKLPELILEFAWCSLKASIKFSIML